jgi:signal transduction histidine kinase
VLLQADQDSLAQRFWASRWPEVAWTAFAVGNLIWMITIPSWSMLPFHFTWMSLLLLYGFGFRTWTKTLLWCLLIPVMAATALLFIDPAIRGLQPYDELIEPPFMIALFSAMMVHSNRRKAAVKELEQISRHNQELLERQRTFVQNASHQLRTPITVALAHSELLPQSEANPAAASDAAIIVDELTRLGRLVDQLLMLATTEQGHLAEPVPVPLGPIVSDAARRWSATPRRWSFPSPGEAIVLADPDRLVLALDAFLENAVEFTTQGDTIELAVRRAGDEIGIVVADSGPGIPDSALESVFERFSSSKNASNGQGGALNFGLGLSIVRAVAEAYGGRVEAGTSPLGGAAVSLWLPARAPVSEARTSSELNSVSR